VGKRGERGSRSQDHLMPTENSQRELARKGLSEDPVCKSRERQAW
jgi:hypothetical protein